MVVASSLPTDILVEIFLLLESNGVIRCAGVCKPWRRAIVGNAASFFRPRPDRFDPRLLLGLFHSGEYEAWLWRTPGPFQSALPSSNGEDRLGGYETVRSLIPAAAAAGFVVDRGLYRELLWAADGFVLLLARTVNRLCLFNPMTGDCTFLPAAAASKSSAYVLLTGYDDAGAGNKKLAVRILAVQKRDRFMFSKEEGGGLSYQVLFTSGAGAGDSPAVWGPVQRSGDESEEQGGLCVHMERRSTLVCRDAVYWLAGPSVGSATCALALDVRTGRTWTTALPQHYRRDSPDSPLPVLATSGAGRLSVIESLRGRPRIQVWVMLRGWTLQQTISLDVSNLLLPPHNCPDEEIALLLMEERLVMTDLSLSAFCPRSGCVVGVCLGRELLIDIHSGSPPRVVRRNGEPWEYDCYPYEMDCSSTYISKMKHC